MPVEHVKQKVCHEQSCFPSEFIIATLSESQNTEPLQNVVADFF